MRFISSHWAGVKLMSLWGGADEAHPGLVGGGLKGHVHGDGVARRLEDIVKAVAAGEGLGPLHVALFPGVDGLVGAHALGQGQAALVDVKGHNLLAAENLGPLQGEDANGAAAQNGHVAAALVAVAQQPVEGHGGGLEHGGLLVGDGGVVLDGVLRGHHHVLGKAALLAAADEAVMLAQGEVALLAVVALHAGEQGRAGDGVPHLDGGDALAYLHHVAGKLVAQHHRVEVGPHGGAPGARRCRRCLWPAPAPSPCRAMSLGWGNSS